MRRRILVVDDDPIFAELVRQTLEPEGYQVDFRDSSFGTLNAVAEGNYDVVIVDLYLPGLKGTRLTRMLRDQPRSPRLLLMSSAEDRVVRRLAKLHGAHFGLGKSAEPTLLLETVARLLGRRAA